MKRKLVSIMLTATLALSLAACGSSPEPAAPAASAETESAPTAESEAEPAEAPAADDGGAKASGGAVAGVCWYNAADTFIANATQCLNTISAADGTISVTTADSQNDITVQDQNVSNFYTQGVKYLVLNNINNAATDEIAKQMGEEGVIGIFANTTSPSEAAFAANENLWYVSSVSEQSGQNMGKALVDYFNGTENWDKNGNGKVDYILLQGMATFSDTINRSSYSLAELEAAGYELGSCIGGEDVTGVKGGDVINGIICNFQRAEAQENVEALLASYGQDIDCIIADNDDEALGAIAALQAHGYLQGDDTYIPVVGVDATVAGCEAISQGTMLETSLNNPVKLAQSIYKLMYLLENGQEVTTESVGIDGVVVEGHSLRINYVSITADNLADANYDITTTDF